ncbi:MAG: acetate kinase [Coriobacteriia bacterium]|nr:acetate kinase [Coriobacteriia bacterium]
MKILVLNTGSSSLKFKLFESAMQEAADAFHHPEPQLKQLCRGLVEAVGTEATRYHRTDERGTADVAVQAATVSDAFDLVLSDIVGADAPLSSLSELGAIGHRIAHAGAEFGCSVEADDHVLEVIEEYAPLAPLHNYSALEMLKHCRRLCPNTLQVAAFDTAFHQTMPARNFVYPIPYRYYEDLGIRRFGFHGMSHKYVSRRAAKFLGKSTRDLKMVTCHLGSGSSVTAIDHGISMDTTMGYTPLDGVIMGTRSGSVDPAIITAIMEKENLTPAEMDGILNRESGLLGVSGVSGDLRELKEVIRFGNEQAELAYDIFLTSIRRMIGAYFFELAGVDVIVCTAGVGENDPYARRLIFRGLEPFGIRLDEERNMVTGKQDRRISADDSAVEVLVIPTDEEAEIARDAAFIAAGVDISDPWAF